MKIKKLGTILLIALGASFANAAGEPDENYRCVGFDVHGAYEIGFDLKFSKWKKGKGFTSKVGLSNRGETKGVDINFLEQPTCQKDQGKAYYFKFKQKSETFYLEYVSGCENEFDHYSAICVKD